MLEVVSPAPTAGNLRTEPSDDTTGDRPKIPFGPRCRGRPATSGSWGDGRCGSLRCLEVLLMSKFMLVVAYAAGVRNDQLELVGFIGANLEYLVDY